jgi:phosphomannomutase
LSLIKSISGIRGTIGGFPGDNLTPVDIVECTAAFGHWILETGKTPSVVIGRDARISGNLVQTLVSQTLVAQGFHVMDLGLSTTPTVEMAVTELNASAGIIITASHNPIQWNALKFLNDKGEFISAEDGKHILDTIARKTYIFQTVENLGHISYPEGTLERHIDKILALPLVNLNAIKTRKFKIVVDPVNSTGSLALGALLEKLGCSFSMINDDLSGRFAHNPEPLPEHLTQISEMVVSQKADLGITVDPDVDRLAFINEDGSMFGEEYTLVAVADYVLSKKGGNTVSNLSSTRALKDITEKHGHSYFAAAVGEVNVVAKMKEVNAVIGGEGNGGIILPELHYGRDALVGVALFLSLLAERNVSISALKSSYPAYEMAKSKIELVPGMNVLELLDKVKSAFKNEKINDIDGVKIDFTSGWVHLRQSNTEPIIRLYAEAIDKEEVKRLVSLVEKVINNN